VQFNFERLSIIEPAAPSALPPAEATRAGHECGAIPVNKIVVVVDRNRREKPTFSHIYRAADLYLNGECTDANGYHTEQSNLVAL